MDEEMTLDQETNYEQYIKPKKYSEINDLIISWLAISLCFVIVLGGYNLLSGIKTNFVFDWNKLPTYIIISLIVTGTSFILHELAHKYSAIYIGAKARFVMWKNSLLLSIAFSAIIGFVFVAPGAVYIFGKKLSLKEDALTSLAGPILNIIIGFLFIIASFLINTQNQTIALVIAYGVFINFWIALFNLIPIGPLDGRKIFLWNPFVWGIMVIIPILFLFIL